MVRHYDLPLVVLTTFLIPFFLCFDFEEYVVSRKQESYDSQSSTLHVQIVAVRDTISYLLSSLPYTCTLHFTDDLTISSFYLVAWYLSFVTSRVCLWLASGTLALLAGERNCSDEGFRQTANAQI